MQSGGSGATRGLSLSRRAKARRLKWNESHHMLTKVRGGFGVVLEFGEAARGRQGGAALRHGPGVQDQRLRSVRHRLVYLVSARKTAGQVGKPDPDGLARFFLDSSNIIFQILERSMMKLVIIATYTRGQIVSWPL
jgi:hypothetical protein